MDPVSAIGLAAAIIQFIEIATKVVKRLSDFGNDASQVPKAFRQTKVELPLVIDGLGRIQEQASSGSHDSTTEKSLLLVVQEFKQTIKKLDDRLDKVIPPAGASSWERKRLAIASLIHDKDVEELTKSIAGYIRVLTFHRVIGPASQLGSMKEPYKPSWVLLPFDRNSTFVGRESIFNKIDQTLDVKAGSQPKAALYGLGGIGKSQIALEYCYRRRDKDTQLCIFWIDAATATGFEESFNRIAGHCELTRKNDSSTDRVLLVWDWLQTQQVGPWLMVIDNVDEPTRFFTEEMRNGKTPSQCIPRCSHGSLLFTTRSSDMAIDLATPANPIPILGLEQEEGMQLVKERLRGKDMQDDQILALLDDLEYIPIAITQAVAFISKRRLKSVAQYLEQYRKSDVARTRMLTYEFTEHGRQDRSLESIAKTWSLSFEVIRNSNPRAADLLCLISFLQHQGIPRMLLLGRTEEEETSGSRTGYGDEGGEDDLEEAIAILRAYSLIDAYDTGLTLSTHHLVQLATQWWLRTERGPIEVARWAFAALKSVARCFPKHVWDPRLDYWTICESLLPHAEPLLNYDFGSIPALASPEEPGALCQRDTDLERARLLVHTGGYLQWQGAASETRTRYEESFRIRARHLGERDIITLESMGKLVWALTWDDTKSNIERAILLGRRLVDLRTDILGPDDRDTIDGLSDLATALHKNGQVDESELLQRDAVSRSTRILGPEHNDTLNCMAHLCDVLESRNKIAEAAQLYRKVYELKAQNLGSDHPDVLTAGHNLALFLTELAGKREEGLLLMRHIYMLKKKVRGIDHTETLITASVIISFILTDREAYAEALAICDEVLEAEKTGPRKYKRDTHQRFEYIRELREKVQRRMNGETSEDSETDSEGGETSEDSETDSEDGESDIGHNEPKNTDLGITRFGRRHSI